MAHLALVRHGSYAQAPDTPSAGQPWPLTSDAIPQCRDGAAEIATIAGQLGLQVHPVVHSSVLLRAWQTAEQLALALGLDADSIATSEDLIERSVGSFANLSLAEINAALAGDPRWPAPPPGWKSDPHYRLPCPGAESLLEAGERVAGYLRALAATAPERELVVVVGHGAAFRHATVVLGALALAQVHQVSMHHARPVVLECVDDTWTQIAGHWKVRGSEPATD